MNNKILRRTEVEKVTGLSRSAIYASIKKGQFPAPIRLTERAVGWLESTINEWIESKINTNRRVP